MLLIVGRKAARGELAPALLLSTPPAVFKRRAGCLRAALMKIRVDGTYRVLPAPDLFSLA